MTARELLEAGQYRACEMDAAFSGFKSANALVSHLDALLTMFPAPIDPKLEAVLAQQLQAMAMQSQAMMNNTYGGLAFHYNTIHTPSAVSQLQRMLGGQ